jgi:hypothetical protein
MLADENAIFPIALGHRENRGIAGFCLTRSFGEVI